MEAFHNLLARFFTGYQNSIISRLPIKLLRAIVRRNACLPLRR